MSNPATIPPEWSFSNIGSVCSFSRGVSWKKSQERRIHTVGAVPVLRIPNVQQSLQLKDLIYVDGLTKTQQAKARVKKGWTLLVGSNGNPKRVGNCVYVAESSGFLFASFLVGAKPLDPENMDGQFLYRLLSSRPVQEDIWQSVQGSTGLSNIDLNLLKGLQVPIPPLPEQRKIAAILSSVDDAIEKTQAVIDQVQVVKRGLMGELLTRGLPGRHTRFKQTEIGWIPEEWGAVPLENYCARVTDGTHDTPRRTMEGVPLLTSKNIRNGQLVLENSYLIAEQDFIEISKRSRVDSGDVIFGMIGTIGNPVVVPPDVHAFAIKNVALFKMDGDLTKADWLVAYLESPMFARRVLQQRTGNAQKFLPLGFLRKLLIPDAPAEERSGIVGALRAVNRRLRTDEECRSLLLQVKRALMSVLLTGELRVIADVGSP